MNEPGALFSSTMFSGKPLSWIRDTGTLGIKSSWQANYRDVIILNPLNGEVDRYNLTTFSLDVAANRQVMKNKLIAAATPVDSDNDKLPDFWELRMFGNLSKDSASMDSDGTTAITRYSLCSEQAAPANSPQITLRPNGSVSVSYIRRRGTLFGLIVTPEFSTEMATWTPGGATWQLVQTRTLYDGSGGELMEWNMAAPLSRLFFRLDSTLP